jgi:hypothetical protein
MRKICPAAPADGPGREPGTQPGDALPPPTAANENGPPAASAQAASPQAAPPQSGPPPAAAPPPSPLSGPAPELSPDPAYPWESDPLPAETPSAPRVRHDAFTAPRKREFLAALVAAGCVVDACRRVGVAPATVYRHQEEDPAFAEHCRIAVRMTAAPVEIAAWQRAVEGVEHPFACGGEVHVRRRYSDGLLRLLLQGSNPKKYGPNPGFKRKRLLRHERKQMEREIRAELAASRVATDEQVDAALATRLAAYGARLTAAADARGAAGWTRTPDGHWIPPGYGPIPGWNAPELPATAAAQATPAPAEGEAVTPAGEDGGSPADEDSSGGEGDGVTLAREGGQTHARDATLGRQATPPNEGTPGGEDGDTPRDCV